MGGDLLCRIGPHQFSSDRLIDNTCFKGEIGAEMARPNVTRSCFFGHPMFSGTFRHFQAFSGNEIGHFRTIKSGLSDNFRQS